MPSYPEPDPPASWEPENEVVISAERKLRSGAPETLNQTEIDALLWFLIPGVRRG